MRVARRVILVVALIAIVAITWMFLRDHVAEIRELVLDEPVVRDPLVPGELVDGYAYTAVLATRHPLWGALVRLEQALEELADYQWAPMPDPRDRRFEQVVFFESYALADPQDRLDALRNVWRAQYPPVVLDPAELAADQTTRIAWERDRAEESIQRRMASAEAQESRRLALLRARLVRYYQERLTNLAIDMQIRDTEAAAAAEREREQVWAVIEAEIETARRSGREMLAALEEELRSDAEQRIRRARERAEAVMAERQTEMAQAGADLYAEMIEVVQQPWPDTGEGTATATIEADEANLLLDVAGDLRDQAEAARLEKLELQRERMLQSLGRLRAQLKSGTESAAAVVAYRRGINLHLLPGEPARGNDYTGVVAEELEEFWTFGGDQRS